MSQTIDSKWTFTDTNPGIKKNHNPIKIVATIKSKGTLTYTQLLGE